jgi:hypothetical protein
MTLLQIPTFRYFRFFLRFSVFFGFLNTDLGFGFLKYRGFGFGVGYRPSSSINNVFANHQSSMYNHDSERIRSPGKRNLYDEIDDFSIQRYDSLDRSLSLSSLGAVVVAIIYVNSIVNSSYTSSKAYSSRLMASTWFHISACSSCVAPTTESYII